MTEKAAHKFRRERSGKHLLPGFTLEFGNGKPHVPERLITPDSREKPYLKVAL
jgi:hypothetical protein